MTNFENEINTLVKSKDDLESELQSKIKNGINYDEIEKYVKDISSISEKIGRLEAEKIEFDNAQLEKERKNQELNSMKPKDVNDIDWSDVIDIASTEVEEIKNGTYHEDNDNAQYLYEAVMVAVYGEKYFEWMRKNS